MEGRKNRMIEDTGEQRRRSGVGKRVLREPGMVSQPQRRTALRSETGDKMKEKVQAGRTRSDVGRYLHRGPTPSSRPKRRANRNSIASDLQQRIGRRMKLPSGGKFVPGAATAGEMGFSNFRKRPDPKRKTTA